MIKPILVESKEYSDIQLGINEELHLENGESFGLRKYQHTILVDTEAEIAEGNLVYDKHEKPDEIYRIISKPTLDTVNRFKIISSTNKLSTLKSGSSEEGKASIYSMLPQLSPQSIQLLINYYNEHGEMPESVEIETEEQLVEYTNNNSFFGKELTESIKLNQQGEIEIIIPEVEEKIYTRKEAEELTYNAMKTIGYTPLYIWQDWIKHNL